MSLMDEFRPDENLSENHKKLMIFHKILSSNQVVSKAGKISIFFSEHGFCFPLFKHILKNYQNYHTVNIFFTVYLNTYLYKYIFKYIYIFLLYRIKKKRYFWFFC
jgi:hypothetical protein